MNVELNYDELHAMIINACPIVFCTHRVIFSDTGVTIRWSYEKNKVAYTYESSLLYSDILAGESPIAAITDWLNKAREAMIAYEEEVENRNKPNHR